MTKRLKVLVGILVLLCVAAGAYRLLAPPPGPASATARAAEMSVQNGDLEAAAAQWKQALMTEPENGDYHAELAAVYLAQKKYDLAAASLQMAGYFRPKRPHVYCQLAQALVEERRRDEALAALKIALSDTPDCPLALSVQGEQFLRDDNLKDALPAFQRVIELQPEFALAYQKAGYSLLSTNRLDEARVVLEKGLKVSPGDPGIHSLLGELHARKPQDPEAARLAEQHYRAALNNNPEAAKAHSALGKLYLRNNDLEAAREQYQKALALQSLRGEALYGLSQVARRQGKQAEAARYLKVLNQGQAMERSIRELQSRALAQPENVELRVRITRLCLENGLLDEAGRTLAQALTVDPGRRDLRELRARWYALSGQDERAVQEATIANGLPRTP